MSSGEVVPPIPEERFHGVTAPAWADDSRLVEILREEANDADELTMATTDRNRALLLHSADRIETLGVELGFAVNMMDERGDDAEALRVENLRLKSDIRALERRWENE